MERQLGPLMERPLSGAPQAVGWSRLVRDHAGVIVERPLRIVLILVLALVLRWLAHRAINRLTRPTAARPVPRILSPLRERVEANGWLESVGLLSQRRQQRAATIGSVLKSIASVLIVSFAALLILGELGIDLAPLIAGTSIVGVAVAFGAQNLVKDFLSGMFMILEDQYGVGDVIDFEKATGTVEAVGLRVTQLRDEYGTVWYVRNGEVIRVGNMSQGYAQLVIDVPIEADADIDAASAALVAVADTLRAEPDWAPRFIGDPAVQGVESFGREETVLRLVARVRAADQWEVGRELRRRVRDQLVGLRAANADATPPDPGAGPDKEE
jgi:small-conductance mechanosensitive channel